MRGRTGRFLIFLVISLLVRYLFQLRFPYAYSFDLVAWRKVAEILQAGGNPYQVTSFLSWPPAWMQLIFLFKKIALAMHWPFDDVLRGFLILTESALALLLYATLLRFGTASVAADLLIAGIAVNPVAVFQVCQHCNFDVLAGFWILLAVYMLLRFQEHHEARFWLFACLALGLGVLTKTVPLCLSCLLLLSLRKLHLTERFLGVVFLLGPSLLALSVLYVLAPEDVQHKVLGYRSLTGTFGFTGLFNALGATGLLDAWPRIFEAAYGSAWLLLCAWLLGKDTLEPRKIVALAAALLVGIAALGPGYGLQYIYWFLPLLLLLYGMTDRKMRRFLLVLYAVAIIVYSIEYGFTAIKGAVFLKLMQTQTLVDLSYHLSTKDSETLVTLPLWLLYCFFVIRCGRELGREMYWDFQTWRGWKQVPGEAGSQVKPPL